MTAKAKMTVTPHIAFRISSMEYLEGWLASSKADTDGSVGLWISLMSVFPSAIVAMLLSPVSEMEEEVAIC